MSEKSEQKIQENMNKGKKPEKAEKPGRPEQKNRDEILVRILSTDIPGSRNIYTGLTRIKGVSWGISNAICYKLGIDKSRKIQTLNADEIKKISDFIKNPILPEFMLNRRKDFETGITGHFVGSDLDLKKEFDIKRLKKIRSYRGLRHATGQPTRGQRTRSHFRVKGKGARKAVGVVSKPKPAAK
jgi:small subunit ribosomal protein S13